MIFQEFIGRVSGLGLWGVILGASLVLFSMTATLLVVHRNHERNGGWSQGKILFSIISTLLLLISGCWSGWAKYDIYSGYNETKAWVISLGFVLCGLVTSIALQYFANNAINERRSARGSQLLFLVSWSIFWLCISPLSNARFLCENEAIRQEVGQRFAELEDFSQPLIEEYSLYRNKLVPQLVDIHKYLEDMVQEQSKQELGGCGVICRQFAKSADMLWPSVNRLYQVYDPDDPEKELRSAIQELRNSIVNLLAGKEWSAEEIRTKFYHAASSWTELLFKAKNADSPGLALSQALASLDSLLLFLHDYQQDDTTTVVGNRAVSAALSTLEPLINDLQISFQEHNQENGLKSVFHLQSASSHAETFNLATVATIRMGTGLMRKHFKTIWPEALLAFFIDFSAMAFIYAPMTIALLRGKPVQLALEREQRKKLNVRRARVKLDAQIRATQKLENERNDIAKRHDKKFKVLAVNQTKAFEAVEQEFSHRISDINSQRQMILAEMNARLQTVVEDLEKSIKHATSTAEEHRIQGKHEVYQENIKAQYTAKLKELKSFEKQLEENQLAGQRKVSKRFDRLEERERKFFSRTEKMIKNKAAGFEQIQARYRKALAEAEQKLEEARDNLAAIQDNRYSYA